MQVSRNAMVTCELTSAMGRLLPPSRLSAYGQDWPSYPDRIILGEIRGTEAFTFLLAVNTGHPGSMITIHADTPERAIEQLALLVLQTGTKLSREDVRDYVAGVNDIYVQLEREAGRRRIGAISLGDHIRDGSGAADPASGCRHHD